MGWIKLKAVCRKIWTYSKKFWWAIVLGLLFLCAALIGALTRNGAFLAGVLDLMESKRASHAQEMETVTDIHNTEIAEKNLRLQEHLKRRAQLEEEFKKRGESLDKEKESELKRIVDEGYNDPEKLAKDLADAFGLN